MVVSGSQDFLQVHKAPTALGLTSALLAEHQSRSSVQRSLVIFSLASPIGAIVTYIVISILGGGGSSVEATDNLLYWAGCSLLFSAGTFVSLVLGIRTARIDLEI